MPKEYSRTLRVGEQIQRELAQLIQQEVKDPRVGMVTVADVEVTTDMAYAKVYVSLLTDLIEGDDGSKAKEAVAALNHAAGFLRSELSRRLSLRKTPALRFIHDQTTENANRLAGLINRSLAKDAAAGEQGADAPRQDPDQDPLQDSDPEKS